MSLLTSFTRPSGNAQFADVFEPIAWLGTTYAYSTLNANQAYLKRFRVAKPITVSKIEIIVGGVSGNVDVGIYTSDLTTWTRIASSGSVAIAGGNAIQSVTLTASITLVPGVDYWDAVAPDNATATLARFSGPLSGAAAIHASKNMLIMKASSFALPTTLSTMSTVQVAVMTRLVV